MNQHEQERFDALYAKHLQALSYKENVRKQSMDTPEH